jgi:hypothetical protein
MIRYYNVTLPDMVQRLARNGLLNDRTVLHGSIAVRRRSGDGQEILLLAHYSASEAISASPARYDYDEVFLVRETLSVAALLARFDRAAKGAPFELGGGLATVISPPGDVELIPSEDPASGIGARYLINVRAKTTESLPQTGPIMRYGQLSFESLEQALRFWIPLKLNAHSDGRLGNVVVDVPLAAPRFGALTVPKEGVMRVTVENVASEIVPELSGVWQSADAGQIEPFAQKMIGPSVELPRPAWAQRVALWLTLPDSLVTDHYFESATICSRAQRVLFPSDGNKRGDPANVLAQIHAGESESVEFKPFLVPEPGKFDELIHTVIAFANKHGGTIYLGVSNHQEIIGVEHPLRVWSPTEIKGPPDECARRYCAQARAKICDRVMGTIDFHLEPINVSGTMLIRVTVQEGKQKPYADSQSTTIWVRRGANTARPTPDEIRQLMSDGSQGLNPFELP